MEKHTFTHCKHHTIRKNNQKNSFKLISYNSGELGRSIHKYMYQITVQYIYKQ